jgi:tetratricopeptide (TPR) repeat protein
MHVKARIASSMAVTTMDMTFENELDRVLEGRLVFPLPEGSQICRFAMDVGGKLREGVIVAKDKGRQVFESTVRRQIDPGLLEWVKGNNFRARIYPLPARGTKRVVVAYEQEMAAGGASFLYQLPLKFPQPIGHFSIEIQVSGKGQAPEFTLNPFKELGFRVEDGTRVARTHFDNMTVDGELSLRIPGAAAPTEVYTGAHGKETYFCLFHHPEVKEGPRELPGRVTVLWDASGSGPERDLPREIRLLLDYIGRMKDPEVTLVPFRNTADPARTFRGESLAGDLGKALGNLAYDGGTDFGCLDLTAFDESADEILLFSDGNANFGAETLRTGRRPVRIFSSSPSANHNYLRHIARKSGGEYFNLLRNEDAAVLRSLSTGAFQFLGVEADDGAVADLYPAAPRRVHGRFALTGRLLRPDATLTLRFGFEGKVTETHKVEVAPRAVADVSGSVPRLWARRHIEELSVFPEKNEKPILAAGRKFRIVTPATSLIVLDSIQDYVRHEIVPPPELEEKYWEIVERAEAQKKKAQSQRIAEVLARWKGLQAWWQKVFKYPENLRLKSKEKKEAEGPTFGEDGGSGDEEGEAEEGVEREGRPAEEGRARRAGREPGAPAAFAGKKNGGKGGGEAGGIRLAKWDPKTPYLGEIRKAGKEGAYSAYLVQRRKYTRSSAFFLDVADHFIDAGQKDLGLRILSNIAEMEIENHQLLRILGHRLEQLGKLELAAFVFRKVLGLRPEEPQSYRDLGLVLAKAGKYGEAAALLYRVVLGTWDDRFPEIDQIALVEMNEIIHRGRKAGVEKYDVDPRFLQLIDVDLRIILNWDADNCDMDLWIIEPSGEKCFYSNRNTTIGGRMSCDFTGGYGPEEYLVRRAMPGKYLIQVNYYGNTQQVIAGATTIQVLLVKNFGRPNEERISLTRRLRDQKEVLTIGDVTFEKEKKKKD